MAYDKCEMSFPCLCKAGHLIAEWEEHDTWPSPNKHYSWHFDCEACAAEHTIYGEVKAAIVRTADAERHQTMTADYWKARGAIKEYATPRYEKQWVDYILKLPSRRAMHSAIGASISYSTFLNRSTSQKAIEYEARTRFHVAPKKCIDRLGITDDEIERLEAEAERLDTAKNEFWRTIEKHSLPIP